VYKGFGIVFVHTGSSSSSSSSSSKNLGITPWIGLKYEEFLTMMVLLPRLAVTMLPFFSVTIHGLGEKGGDSLFFLG
jgi:hypothetical protein